jgi:predicted secreted hydrolase
LGKKSKERNSNWAAENIYMGHFALTDPESDKFYHYERFARDSIGLAGSEAVPLKVWLENWSITSAPSGFPMHLSAETEDISIEFLLETSKPVVLQGDQGLSQKSPEPGNASYYYSLTRMPTKGVIRIHDQKFTVSGSSWLDREWSTSVLGDDQVGWDWFSLQLEDDYELMYYQLRKNDGTADPLSSGVIVDPKGKTRPIKSRDLQVQILNRWQSPETGAYYPNHWKIIYPEAGLALEIIPVLPGQEMKTSVRYWEGAVDVKGEFLGRRIEGVGYVELTGY